jgi:hypothetical protein
VKRGGHVEAPSMKVHPATALVILGVAGLLAYGVARGFASLLLPGTLSVPASPGEPTTAHLELDFGVLPRGGVKAVTFSIPNPEANLVEPAPATSSCDCFTVVLQSKTFQAGEDITGMGKIDFTADPEFTGRLRITAVLHSIRGSTIAEIVAYVRVQEND